MKLTEQQVADYVERLSRLVDQSIKAGDYPFACLLLDQNGDIECEARNTCNHPIDPTAHAEIQVLRQAATKHNTTMFEGWGVFLNAQPCNMCMSSLIRAGVTHFYWGADAEPNRMNPSVPVDVFQQHSKQQLHITTGINYDAFAAQIASAR